MVDAQKRRLAAIMMLDVVGYSRMMAQDESAFLGHFLDLRTNLIETEIVRTGGRLVKLMGDGALVEFTSATEALTCARAIQDGMAQRNAALPEPRRINLRIGINLGEVIVDGDDIYGNGVNVAARVEPLASPGGIAVTAAVKEHLLAGSGLEFRDAGEVSVKNIPHPVRVFHVQPAQGAAGPVPIPALHRRFRNRAGIALLLLVALSVLAASWLYLRPAPSGAVPPVAGPDMAEAANKPSVAVMPFENLSGDPAQDYFSDGMADNLITDLSQIGGLLVIARNTSFSFRDLGEDANPRNVGASLGVRYVVEGSVQRSGDHVRINLNLIDAQSGFQIWADRLDREFNDLFALQDEAAAQIIKALEVELTQEERRRLSKRYTTSLQAYDAYLRAWEEIWRFNEESRQRAQVFFREALRIDPKFALAKAMLATTYTNRTGVLPGDNDAELAEGFRLAQEAVELDPDLPAVQMSIGLVQMFRREFDQAELAFATAIELDPNNADSYAMQAWNRHYAGHPEQALDGFRYALLLNPRAPFPYLNALAEVYFSLGDYDESVRYNLEAVERNPEALRSRIFLAAAFVGQGAIDDAEWEIQEALLRHPSLSIANIEKIAPYEDQAISTRLADNLRRAGLPD